jgi:hypothetical protein
VDPLGIGYQVSGRSEAEILTSGYKIQILEKDDSLCQGIGVSVIGDLSFSELQAGHP